MKPKFIVFEGIDGCGKGTSIKFAKSILDNQNIPNVSLRDPGQTVIGERIREILLDPKHTEMSRETELLLYVAARSQLLKEQIEPALASGNWVLCDRYDLSTLAYQYVFGQWSDDVVFEAFLKLFGKDNYQPDRYILLDVPVHIGQTRVGKNKDRQEQRASDLFEKVRQRYLMYANKWNNISVIDSSQSISDTLSCVQIEIEKIIEGVY